MECVLAAVITMLDIAMQPFIQEISSQIIDSSPYFPERFCDFSCMRIPDETKSAISCRLFLARNLQEKPILFTFQVQLFQV